MADVFVGREPELELLRRALDAVRAGQPSTLLIEGQAGIGKTAFVRHFLAGHEGLHVLSATGDEGEAALAYGVMDQFWVQVGLRQPPATPLLGSGHGTIPEPVAVGAELVGALGSLQDCGVVVLLLDDAMWSDTPSLQALTFALRRLHADRVLTLILLRQDTTPRLPEGLRRLLDGERGHHLQLQGLDGPTLRRLSSALGRPELTERAVERLRAHTAGNPLYFRALLDEVSPTALSDPDRSLAAPRSLSLSVLARVAECAPQGRELAIAGSLLGVRFSIETAACLAQVDDPLVALEQMVKAGLIQAPEPGDTTAVFTHPLVQAAIYQDLGPARRAAMHLRAADLLGDEAASLRHLVAATTGRHDAVLSSRVAAFARREAQRGALSSAGSHLLWAARFSPDREEGERLLLEALEYMVLGGDADEAAGHAPKIAGFGDAARRQYGLGFFAFVSGRVSEADEFLMSAWGSCDRDREPELAARIAGRLAFIQLNKACGLDAAAWSRRTLELTSADNPLAFGAQWSLHCGLAISGNAAESLEILAALPEVSEDPMANQVDLTACLARGPVRLWTDDLERARTDFSGCASRWNQVPMPYGLFALGGLSDTCYRLGEWDEAVVYGELAASTAEDTGQVWVKPFLHAYAASPLAGRGEWHAAGAHATAALTLALTMDDCANLAFARSAAALVASARGAWADVVGVASPLRGISRRDGTDEPGILPWRELFIDALINLDCLEEAHEALVPFEEIAAARGRRSAMGNAARVRGRLEAARGCREKAEAAFLAALDHAAVVPIPFDRAQTELAYGAFLRRAGRRAEAVALLKASRERLAELKARPYLERCDRELSACGLRPVKRKGGARPATLTPQELSVASLVTSGLTNRQVAAELVVSTKTVEYHLANVFGKLGVSSRTQLAAHLSRQ